MTHSTKRVICPSGGIRQVIFLKNFFIVGNFMKLPKIYIKLFSLISFIFLLSLHSLVLGEEIPQGLTVQVQYMQQGKKLWAIVELGIAENYYAYAPKSSSGELVDAEQATQLVVKNAVGQYLPVYMPWGQEREDYYEKGKRISAFTKEVYLFVDLGFLQDMDVTKESIHGKLSLLLCSTKHCLPVRIPLQFTLTPELLQSVPSLEKQSYADVWRHAVQDGALAPSDTTSEATYGQSLLSSSEDKTQENLSGLAAGLARFKDSTTNEAGLVSLHQETQKDTWSFSPRVWAQSLEVKSLSKALVLGLLAGLILNLMPCVLPVLTLKMQSLMLTEEGEGRVRAFREHNLFFAAGILTQFLLLGLVLGSLGLIWGELFQNVTFVLAMLVIIFVLALSLLGVFTLPMLDMKSSSTGDARQQAFMTGMVATLLATPCSGPLLGGVLSWAFLQPIHFIVLIIMAVGVGMTLPYVLFAWQPQWVRFLPKPGAWMELLEKMVAFFLLGTVIYIFSILPKHAHIPVLFSLLFLAIMAWIWGQFGGLAAPVRRRRMLALAFIVSMVGVVAYAGQEPIKTHVVWQPFSATSFQDVLGKRPLLVEFTADWCPNCKYVEKTVLTEENLQKWQEQYGIELIKVDITRDNVAGEALLHALGSKSIPFTAVFGVGDAAQRPVVIRDIYTQESLESVLQQALE